MKRYKLKKDLPRAKAGSEVVLFNVKDNPYVLRINLYQEGYWNNSRLGFINKEDTAEWLEDIPEKPTSIWELKEGEKCYYLDTNGDIVLYYLTDKHKLKYGNIFLTHKEAEKELSKRISIQNIKQYCFENDIEVSEKYNYNSFRYSFEYTIIKDFDGGNIDGFDVDEYGNNGNHIGYFKSIDDAQKVIDNCERDLLIIFNIK